MSLRGALAGKIAFGLTAGLAGVFLLATDWSFASLSPFVWVPWLGAIVLTGLTLSRGRPLFLVAASGLLLVAAFPLLAGTLWVLPLAGSAGVLLAARLSTRFSFLTRWAARGIGTVAGIGLGWGLVSWAWDGFEATPTEMPGFLLLLAALAALLVVGWWPKASED